MLVGEVRLSAPYGFSPREVDRLVGRRVGMKVCLSAQSIVHGDVLSEKLISPHTGP